MSRVLGVLTFLLAAGCAGRWLALPEPSRLQPSKPGPRRDYRVVLLSDSVVVLLDAVVRDDSIVELPQGETNLERAGAPRGVAIADVAEVERWQPGGERLTGASALAIVGALVGFIVLIAISVPRT